MQGPELAETLEMLFEHWGAGVGEGGLRACLTKVLAIVVVIIIIIIIVIIIIIMTLIWHAHVGGTLSCKLQSISSLLLVQFTEVPGASHPACMNPMSPRLGRLCADRRS